MGYTAKLQRILAVTATVLGIIIILETMMAEVDEDDSDPRSCKDVCPYSLPKVTFCARNSRGHQMTLNDYCDLYDLNCFTKDDYKLVRIGPCKIDTAQQEEKKD